MLRQKLKNYYAGLKLKIKPGSGFVLPSKMQIASLMPANTILRLKIGYYGKAIYVDN